MNSFPWTSTANGLDEDGFPNYDRKSTAEDLQAIFARFFSDGVAMGVDGGLQVMAGSGMNVTVKTGWCCINGTFGNETEERTIALQGSNATYDRIDTIVARWNKNVDARYIELYAVQGTPAQKPVRPTLTRNASVYEIGLADVFVSAGSGALSQQRITDTRIETDRCGVMTPFAEVDTSGLLAQIQDYLDTSLANFDAQQATALETFNTWFDNIKGQLDTDAAGNLQNQLDLITFYYVKDTTLYLPNTSASVSDDGVLTIGTTTNESEA